MSPPSGAHAAPDAIVRTAPIAAADSVIYQVVRDRCETFVAQAASLRDGEGLPAFIDEEFRGFALHDGVGSRSALSAPA